jgi:hypothetical protein
VVHAPAPRAHVVVHAPPPPRAHVVVHAPPPPRAQVVVHAPPPPRAHVVVQAPTAHVVAPPPPHVTLVAAPPAVRVAVPSIAFEARPEMVVVAPGIRIVDCEEDVFFVGGWYWHPGPHGWWYRTHSYRGGWVAVPPRAVPVRLAHVPPGQLRHWHQYRRQQWAAEARWQRYHHGRHGR